jgi:hypothetical protein
LLKRVSIESQGHWGTQESRVQGLEAKSSLTGSKVVEHEEQLRKHDKKKAVDR